MSLRTCSCGSTPKILTCHDGPKPVLQLVCRCGRTGTAISYVTPEEKTLAAQAAVDGWNLSA